MASRRSSLLTLAWLTPPLSAMWGTTNGSSLVELAMTSLIPTTRHRSVGAAQLGKGCSLECVLANPPCCRCVPPFADCRERSVLVAASPGPAAVASPNDTGPPSLRNTTHGDCWTALLLLGSQQGATFSPLIAVGLNYALSCRRCADPTRRR